MPKNRFIKSQKKNRIADKLLSGPYRAPYDNVRVGSRSGFKVKHNLQSEGPDEGRVKLKIAQSASTRQSDRRPSMPTMPWEVSSGKED